MSEFAPGFSGRIRAAEHILARAFGDGVGFAPSEVDQIGRRAFEEAPAQPRHFAPANPRSNPTEGWDPFSTDTQHQVEPGPFIDPIAAAHDAGFAEGHAAAMLEAEAARAREAALLDQVTSALASGAHFDRERMAGHLRQTVLHLVTRLVGEVGIAPDVLAARINAATDLLADGAESALLRLHPDDVAFIQDKLPASVFPIGDPHVPRGGFVIESASTVVEDGPDLWLEQLAQAIDRVPIPPAC